LFSRVILELQVEMFTQVFFQFGSIVFGDIEVTDYHHRHAQFAFQPQVIDEIAVL
jgi:hypothetical protein